MQRLALQRYWIPILVTLVLCIAFVLPAGANGDHNNVNCGAYGYAYGGNHDGEDADDAECDVDQGNVDEDADQDQGNVNEVADEGQGNVNADATKDQGNVSGQHGAEGSGTNKAKALSADVSSTKHSSSSKTSDGEQSHGGDGEHRGD